jgi:hypothetical protein
MLHGGFTVLPQPAGPQDIVPALDGNLEAKMRKSGVSLLAIVLLVSAQMPAHAQATMGIFFGDEPTDLVQPYFTCLTDAQIRDALLARGFTDISLNVLRERHVTARGTLDGVVYLLDYNFCADRIESRRAVRAAE